MKAFKNVDNPQQVADTASKLIRSKIRTGRIPNSSLGKQGCPFPLFELKVVNPDYKERLSKVAAWKTTAKIVDPDRCSRCGEQLPGTLHPDHQPACEACGLDAAIAIDEAEAPQWSDEINRLIDSFVSNKLHAECCCNTCIGEPNCNPRVHS